MGSVEIPNWLGALPLAPEFRPTDTEFADPIAYISKIEKEAGAFGICKVIPPLPKPSKKYVFGNLNKSLLKCPELGSANLSSSSKVGTSSDTDGEARAVFTTRQQELGQSVKKSKGTVQSSGAHKQVWQSGEIYTLEQFEAKSRVFAKSQLGTSKDVSPLVIEALFWKAALEKPMYLEYANDVPGSGFGEPEGQFRYFHRRRRKRNFFTRSRESSSCKTDEMDSDNIEVSRNDDSKLASCRNESCTDVSLPPSSPPELLTATKEASQSSKKRSQSCVDNKEGSAGWKISNSPWNLQVISRAPGSLTRFMPDDIPGVTSPMVYIGMLFSWFAWHVEDHELHSMNFLHTGASKTWYSVPGDYAFAFEEVVRTEAYGANIDRIASLALLGEKTTLMSPELAVASGIPCCRLVQNPGEFVVTFPRAYHIGFSHGFNCGEAANFGTPQWLKVAKEAAVRRAAMNYLPMLSHQQLLYLLTMSFVSRVPRSFLPGVRSSRLRDRQKEEKEFLVKKAFIEDILHENKTVSALLGKNSGYRAIFWNKGLLAYPSSTETVSPPSAGDTGGTTSSTEKPSHTETTNKANNEHPCLWDEMSLCLENLDDLYLGSDDLSCDFQVDSGTLPCVACGILGFPFMSVVQPSEMAALHLQNDLPETTGCLKLYSSSQILDASNHFSYPENASTLSNSLSAGNLPLPSIVKSNEGWNVDNNFLRPRSFCLEHAAEMVDLLQSKGGANVLVICHSDYKKIRAHATTIAEEIGCAFDYTEVALDMASKEDMQLIDLAIEDGELKVSSEDWTSKLGINLRHCVKIRKNSASKQVQRALTLGGLFSKTCSRSDFSGVKWKIRRTRSKKMYFPEYSVAEPKSGALAEKHPLAVRKETKKLIQYTRRRLRTKQGDSSGAGTIHGNPATLMDCEHVEIASKNKIPNAESSTSIEFSPITVPRMQSESRPPIEPRDESSKLIVGGVEIHSSEGTESDIEAHRLAVLVKPYQMQTEPDVAYQKVGDSDELDKENRSCVSVHSSERRSMGICEEKVHTVETDEACNVESEGHSKSQAYPRCTVPVDEKPNSCVPSVIEHTLLRPMPICSAEVYSNDMKPEEAKSGTNEQPMITEVVVSVSTEVTSEIVGDSCAGLTSDDEPQKKEGTSPGMLEEFASCSVTHVEVQTGNSHQSDVVSDVILGDCSKPEAPVENGVQGSASFPTEMEEPAKDRPKERETVLGTATELRKYSRVRRDARSNNVGDGDSENATTTRVQTCSNGAKSRKRNRELEQLTEESKFTCNGFTRSPCEGLRPRRDRNDMDAVTSSTEERPESKKALPTRSSRANNNDKKKKKKEREKEKEGEEEHMCDIEGCKMSFGTKRELSIHKGNRCPHEGCGKKFRTHKYAAIHHRVHFDERPLKCPWEGCSMAFKWAWARTEHIRVHTGEKPYKCTIHGCGLSFRFVSDFSRHRRKTGHSVDA